MKKSTKLLITGIVLSAVAVESFNLSLSEIKIAVGIICFIGFVFAISNAIVEATYGK